MCGYKDKEILFEYYIENKIEITILILSASNFIKVSTYDMLTYYRIGNLDVLY